MKKINLTALLLTISFSTISCAATEDSAKADSSVKNSNTGTTQKIIKLPNRGFVKKPSEELKKQFPMCDDFLNVEWLDKENGFGYVEHDLYKNGSMIGPKKSLIYIHGNQADHMFNLEKYEKFGKLEQVLEAIKKGNKVYSNLSTIPAIEYKDTKEFFEHYDYTDESYADHHQNVCIPYPDNKRMWVVESRQVGKVYSQSQIDKYFPEMKKIYPTYRLEWFLKPSVNDINHDGIDDYYSIESFTFSNKGSYQSIVKLGNAIDTKGQYYLFGIKDTDNVCKIYKASYDYLTTDGENYFLGNECNLTQLATF